MGNIKRRGKERIMNIYEYLYKILELLGSALNNLSPYDFRRLLNMLNYDVSNLLKDCEDDE